MSIRRPIRHRYHRGAPRGTLTKGGQVRVEAYRTRLVNSAGISGPALKEDKEEQAEKYLVVRNIPWHDVHCP